MAKLKKYNIHAMICSNCKGNGYIKMVLEEGREHVVLQCPECDSEGEIYIDKFVEGIIARCTIIYK